MSDKLTNIARFAYAVPYSMGFMKDVYNERVESVVKNGKYLVNKEVIEQCGEEIDK